MFTQLRNRYVPEATACHRRVLRTRRVGNSRDRLADRTRVFPAYRPRERTIFFLASHRRGGGCVVRTRLINVRCPSQTSDRRCIPAAKRSHARAHVRQRRCDVIRDDTYRRSTGVPARGARTLFASRRSVENRVFRKTRSDHVNRLARSTFGRDESVVFRFRVFSRSNFENRRVFRDFFADSVVTRTFRPLVNTNSVNFQTRFAYGNNTVREVYRDLRT